ncbi:hypothetical protein ZYGR_0AL01750 [Zygosaccharomyces rouxii]|uniref:Uncharacterized protein n=1 Tax=Zygosaccharomyces rouxii TaxID=4956 RepID=A0A1Q3AG38_ZYGRO|nr:hypothetical protein ZYGR_0AL01750 [Zygosaccharomyces rouxii]
MIFLQCVAGISSSIAILYQKRYNRLHHSVYGLSYDLYLLEIVGQLLILYCTINYKWSSLVRLQLSKRFPLFYPLDGSSIPISKLLLVKDAVLTVCSLLVLRQLVLYQSTKHMYQGFSTTCLSILGIFAFFSMFTYFCACHNLPQRDSGKFGIFYVEHINYLWVIGNAIRAFKFLPQLTINWMGFCTRGISSKYIIVNSLACLLLLFESLALSHNKDFHQNVFNSCPWIVTFVQFLSLCAILYQAQCLYVKNKPYLPRSG